MSQPPSEYGQSGKKLDETYEDYMNKERLLQVCMNECMLCLTEISNCVIMECGHSSICFDCTMRLAIKSRS